MEKLGNWIYMVQKEMTVREIQEAVKDNHETEIWEELGVLEIELPGGAIMDIEETSVHPKDEETQSFVAAHQVACLFYVSFPVEEIAAGEQIMKQIIEAKGGFFCGDTEGFMPIIK